jgi:hypothetical protein
VNEEANRAGLAHSLQEHSTMSVADVVAQSISEMIEPANELGAKIKQSAKVSGKVVSEIRNDEAKGDQYPWLADFQKWEDEANAEILKRRQEINARIKSEIIGEEDNGFDLETAQTEHKDMVAQIKLELKALKVLDEAKHDELAATLQGVNVRLASAAGETKRPRLSEAYVDGEQVKDDAGKVSFTSLAKYLSDLSKAKVNGADLQAAVFAAAETDTLSEVSGQTIEIEFPVDENSAPYSITVVPL